MTLPMSLRQAVESLQDALRPQDKASAVTRKRAGPAKILLLGYLSYMIAGWVLLSLPFAQEHSIGALDNLFIAVSAVSTTGLVTIDPGASYNVYGEFVILMLIQFGGLGYMTMSSFGFLSLHSELNDLQERTTRTAFALPNAIDPRLFIRAVVLFTFATEAAGALALYPLLTAAGDPAPLWNAVFHAISAFCTAGFSLYSEGIARYRTDVGINLVLSALSLLGAMGFIVVADAVRRMSGHARHFGFTTKVILRMTVVLVTFGTLLIFLTEPSLATLPAAERLLAAFFQATSASTTVGFNTIDVGAMAHAPMMVLFVLMIIGASPSGTGGGIKTTSLAALIGLVRSTLKGRDQVRFAKRQVPDAQLQMATTTLACYSAVLAAGLFLLFLTDAGKSFEALSFEAVSALGTVGLSMGVTGDLSPLGKLVIILLMTIGRLGVLTFGFAVAVPDESRAEESDNDLAL